MPIGCVGIGRNALGVVRPRGTERSGVVQETTQCRLLRRQRMTDKACKASRRGLSYLSKINFCSTHGTLTVSRLRRQWLSPAVDLELHASSHLLPRNRERRKKIGCRKHIHLSNIRKMRASNLSIHILTSIKLSFQLALL